MTPFLADWLDLGLRWVHFIAGIAWIGSSFYFIWLDSHLTLPDRPKERVEGEVWMVHSGGFYLVERRRIGPGQMPAMLHWFKWEALITWISGVFLLAIIYYLTGGIYLVDPAVSPITAGQATALAVGLLVVSWLVYDQLWARLGVQPVLATALSVVLLAGVAYGLCRVLSGRAAYIHVGAMLGTLMVANVWLRILPAQQQMIDATAAGREPDFTLGAQAKRRSVHNSYMTFPVLFIMLSNHFPTTFGHRLNWLVLGLLIVAGGAARHVMIGKGAQAKWALVPVVASVLALVGLTAPPRASGPGGAAGDRVAFAAVRAVISERCLGCHSSVPTDPTLTAPPLGVTFDTPESIQRFAERIKERTVVSRTMPLMNKTGMTEAERALVARWVEQGAMLRN